jgi:hypothetical protein
LSDSKADPDKVALVDLAASAAVKVVLAVALVDLAKAAAKESNLQRLNPR